MDAPRSGCARFSGKLSRQAFFSNRLLCHSYARSRPFDAGGPGPGSGSYPRAPRQGLRLNPSTGIAGPKFRAAFTLRDFSQQARADAGRHPGRRFLAPSRARDGHSASLPGSWCGRAVCRSSAGTRRAPAPLRRRSGEDRVCAARIGRGRAPQVGDHMRATREEGARKSIDNRPCDPAAATRACYCRLYTRDDPFGASSTMAGSTGQQNQQRARD